MRQYLSTSTGRGRSLIVLIAVLALLFGGATLLSRGKTSLPGDLSQRSNTDLGDGTSIAQAEPPTQRSGDQHNSGKRKIIRAIPIDVNRTVPEITAKGCDIHHDKGCSRGNNYTSDSICIGSMGSNCHKYRDEVEIISQETTAELENPLFSCVFDKNSSCVLTTRSKEHPVKIGATGGLSAEKLKTELDMEKKDTTTLSATCKDSTDRPAHKGGRLILSVTLYRVVYDIASYYEKGGGLAQRSVPQYGIEAREATCTIVYDK